MTAIHRPNRPHPLPGFSIAPVRETASLRDVTRRRLLLVLAGLLLAVLSGLLWQFRFEHSAPAAHLRIDIFTHDRSPADFC